MNLGHSARRGNKVIMWICGVCGQLECGFQHSGIIGQSSLLLLEKHPFTY